MNHLDENLDEKEEKLRARLEKLDSLEKEIKAREKAMKARENAKNRCCFVCLRDFGRISPSGPVTTSAQSMDR